MKLFIFGLFLSSPLFGFSTAYVSFEHPENWKCELAQGVWVCQSAKEVDRKESVVLSIATVATEWDTLDNFEEYLKQTRTTQDEQGKQFTSEVRYTRKRNINGHVWVDALQFNSELPGFWSRYVATVHTTPKAKLAILITYIVSDDRYKKLAPEFERMVSSLKPNDEIDLNVASKQGDLNTLGADRIGPLQKDLIRDRLNIGKKKPEVKETPESGGSWTPFVLLGVVVAVAFFILKKRRAKKDPNQDKAA